jgi:hypothetical protein
MSEISKIGAGLVGICAIISAISSYAACPTAFVIVKGHVENAPHNSIVRVQLVYLRQQTQQVEDSSDMTLESGTFTIKVPFYTQSRGPVVNGQFEKCNRKPKTVIVSLLQDDHEYDRVSSDFARDFTMPYPGAYALRSEIVLHGPLDPH